MGQPASFDTNILIDALNGSDRAAEDILRYADRAISMITWIEVWAGVRPGDEARVERFLGSFTLIAVTPSIGKRAAELRAATRLKLPDAIILATAQIHGRMLITRNSRDFQEDPGRVHLPYAL